MRKDATKMTTKTRTFLGREEVGALLQGALNPGPGPGGGGGVPGARAPAPLAVPDVAGAVLTQEQHLEQAAGSRWISKMHCSTQFYYVVQ